MKINTSSDHFLIKKSDFKDLFNIMKICLFLLFAFAFQLMATNTNAQDAIIELRSNSVTVSQLISEIEKQTDYLVVYSNREVNTSRTVSLKNKSDKVSEYLNQTFSGTDIGYDFENNYIVLSKKAQQTASTITNLVQTFQQQGKTVTGTVTDSNGEPIIGANIIETGTTNGTVTDVDGKFSLIVNNNATIRISYIGYLEQTVNTAGRTSIDVILKEDTHALDEVVVVGYGTQKKINLTGSVSTVSSEDLKAASSANISHSLAGKLPGLIAIVRSGEPGRDDATLRIRGLNTLGDNSPLIVVDGIAGRQLTRLNSEDIESISVLKDASAAIYGAQAANGVILVTTKRGSERKAESKITVNLGWGSPTNTPKMADAATLAEYVNEIYYYRNQDPKYSAEEIQKYRDGSDPVRYPSTNWFGETFKDFSPERNVDYSVYGGTNIAKYFISLGSKFQDGAYKNSGTNYSQINFRSNMDVTLSKDINVSFNLAGRAENRNFGRFTGGTLYRYLMLAYPNTPAFYPNGLPGPDIMDGINPAYLAQKNVGGYIKNKSYVMESNIGLNINIPWIKGLSLNNNISVDKTIKNNKDWTVPWYLYSWDGVSYDENNEPLLKKGEKGVADPRLSQSMEDGQRITMNSLLNYAYDSSAGHNFKLLAGVERIIGNNMNFNAFRRYFLSTEIDQMFAGGDADKNNGGSASESARLNYFGRFNYDYKGKYLAEFVFRYDGSYIFPADKRFGFFPGISLGWRISEENFWKNSFPQINYLKLRGSIGQTGNDRIEEYQYLSTYAFSSVYTFNQQTDVKSLKENRIPNPNVTWEVANQSNLGFDAQLFNGKLSFTGEAFYNVRTNILWYRNASVPNFTGLTLPRENIGEVVNRGIEVVIGYNDNLSDFKYSLSVNGAYQKNKIRFWDETPGVPDYQKTTGYPMNSSLYYEAIGIFKDQAALDAYPHWNGARPGDIIFKDVNKDDVIDGLDRVRQYKSDIPRFTGGMNIDLEYKNFYSNIFINGASGAVLNTFIQWTGLIGNGFMSEMEDRWTEDNTDASKPRARNQTNEYWCSQSNTYWLRSTDYIRLKNVEIGYRIPDAKKLFGINDLRIYVSGSNIATLTKLKNFDPESNSNEAYPPNKVYNVGATLTF